MARMLTPAALAERSLLSDFRKPIWRLFVRAVKTYDMISPGDKIAVCISGGKDSMMLAKLMQLLHRHTDVPFSLEFIVMDPGYNPKNRQRIIDNAARLEIPIKIFDSDIFSAASAAERNPCYLCARMRRGFLYDRARELGCNKIALGHHFNDVVETTVMGMFYGAQLQAMLPKLHSRNFPGMELIRPMYCIHEEDILAWRDFNHLEFIACACRFTEARDSSGNGIGDSKRQEIKLLLKMLRETNPDIEKNVFSAIHAVSLDTMPGWKIGGQSYSFLDEYDKKRPQEEDIPEKKAHSEG